MIPQGIYHACVLHVPFPQGQSNIQCQWYGHNCSGEAAESSIWLAGQPKK